MKACGSAGWVAHFSACKEGENGLLISLRAELQTKGCRETDIEKTQ